MDDECWLWTGAKTPGGYGGIWVKGSQGRKHHVVRVHRLVWEWLNGPIPLGRIIMHTCDTPACFNPRHLQLGTIRDNARDASRKGRLVRHTCKRGHSLTGENVQISKTARFCRTCNRARALKWYYRVGRKRLHPSAPSL